MSSLTEKMKNMATGNKDKVEKGVDTAATAADKVTKGKHSEKIDSAAEKAKDALPGDNR